MPANVGTCFVGKSLLYYSLTLSLSLSLPLPLLSYHIANAYNNPLTLFFFFLS